MVDNSVSNGIRQIETPSVVRKMIDDPETVDLVAKPLYPLEAGENLLTEVSKGRVS